MYVAWSGKKYIALRPIDMSIFFQRTIVIFIDDVFTALAGAHKRGDRHTNYDDYAYS